MPYEETIDAVQCGFALLATDTWTPPIGNMFSARGAAGAVWQGGMRFTSGLAADSSCETATLTCTVSFNYTTAGTINLHYWPHFTVDVWDNAKVAELVAYTDYPVIATADIAGTEVIGDSVAFTFTASDLDEPALDVVSMHDVTRHSDWDGTLMFYISNPDAAGVANETLFWAEGGTTPPELVWSRFYPTYTGLSGKQGAHSRADTCPRCGNYVVREELVEDGFRAGTMVCSDCYDPEEPEAVKLRPPATPING